MYHPKSEAVRSHREVRRIPVRTRPDLAELVPALGLVPGVDPFVLLDGDGWGTRMLAFDPERVLSIEGTSPFEEIRRLFIPGGRVEGHPAAGPALFGYLSYDAARSLERLPTLAEDDLKLPVARFILPRYVIGVGPEGTWVSVPAGESTSFILRALRRSALLPDAAPAGTLRVARSTLGREEYVRVVERVKEYVRAGDVFQVNISQRFEVPFEGDPLALYGALRSRNPSPFGGMVSFPGLVAVSSSPERLVDLRGRRASTRPIAGTYPKGAGAALLLDLKERAEHAMILDLERNDLGRTAAYGTVRVEEFMTTENYSHVVHIVSEVAGDLAEGRDAVDLLAGMFPGGTITGCPKVRCMEIIEELEPVRRGLYTGSFGYLSLDGSAMDMNIAIRTILLKDGTAYAQAGGGVVADSVPAREYRESVAKAAALLECLGTQVP
jgi:para-aminobenzoate synthetase component I